MAFTYDTSTDRGKVRLIITDTDEDNAIFQDAEIDAFLEMQGGVLLAAAQALDTIASSEALVLKKVRLLDVQTDGPAVAKALREHAQELREEEKRDGAFAIAEQVIDEFQAREYVLNLAERGVL